ncbi:NACHT and WD40 domain protein [Cordyceps fumosorosea ARSEF 2679]|uniref:NACHT and WD40 domain protein n=1 Tax=Cordyceps fumosorosea (strain ARSEF 2679) TaxID=1081104 RepID=A0A162M068_CORFA|nr:NACHT and WD40 domain protein [Cordyceps fumosorosea ARSEF 2679]OAA47970.1 NACHT and WD40 domain protein [Cordyceps fumosorosea ARSEF 2679]
MVFRRTPKITTAPISAAAQSEFGARTSPLWCRQLLADRSLQPVSSAWRSRNRALTNEDSFLASTLNTPDTIRAWHALYRALPPDDDEDRLAGELLCLFALGSGVNGHPDVAHGGVTAAILDAATGSVAELFSTEGDSAFTLELTVRYRRPLATPGVYVCRSWVRRRTEGRKAWLRAVVEDGNGTVYAEGDAFWLDVPRSKL